MGKTSPVLMLVLILISCRGDNADVSPPAAVLSDAIEIRTDLVRYEPGQQVQFSVNHTLTGQVQVRYKHLHQVIDEHAVSGTSWQWTPPADNYKGYMAEVFVVEENTEKILGTVAIDVSGDWKKFPRYGFLSKYPQLSESEMDEVIDNLARHHINGLQFYDWHYKHHQPLAGSAQDPDDVYHDIIGRDIYFNTVRYYIKSAHEAGMKAMSYNLIYGALEGAAADGVSSGWYLYEDQNQQKINKHPLPQPPFISDIYLTNPANTGWQEYLVNENAKVYQALDFDGFHMDQLGNRNVTLYDAQGTVVDVAATFQPFIEAMKQAHPTKDLVLNAVNQYGQEQIAAAPVSFLYTEVWDPNSGFADLANIILSNNSYGSKNYNSVLAAYINYNVANNPGVFNTPAVLLADAVIFAFGGAHLELGEHMLGKEYFPNDNLMMRSDLQEALVEYYDFLTAYENLLRDGGQFNQPVVSTTFNIPMNIWPPKAGSVSVVGKAFENRQILHFINFKDAVSLEWRDTNGSQHYPSVINGVPVKFTTIGAVKGVWMASPDINGGASFSLDFVQQENEVSFNLPSLHFWNMVVIEYNNP